MEFTLIVVGFDAFSTARPENINTAEV
jgi:hypothetical protein